MLVIKEPMIRRIKISLPWDPSSTCQAVQKRPGQPTIFFRSKSLETSSKYSQRKKTSQHVTSCVSNVQASLIIVIPKALNFKVNNTSGSSYHSRNYYNYQQTNTNHHPMSAQHLQSNANNPFNSLTSRTYDSHQQLLQQPRIITTTEI